jgi:Lipocalin-like domain
VRSRYAYDPEKEDAVKFKVTVLSLLCLAIPALSTEAAAQQNALKQQLVGTWSVVSFNNENETTGKRREVFGSDPKGLFMFDETGHFSINLVRPGRPKFGYRDFPTRAESKAALEGIITMFGHTKLMKTSIQYRWTSSAVAIPLGTTHIRSVSSRSMGTNLRIETPHPHPAGVPLS